MRVIATAGHVDHGKSSLVLALTGTDPDRLAEEKRRGLTIELGFAHTTLPSGEEVSLVDVPGHVRFLRNMLAGVGSVDACLFVVAATEGWKPQSEEHLRILELLGVADGVIALTKVDQVDPDLIELATLEVSERVAGSFLAGAPIVPVAAPPGGPPRHLDELRAALDELVRRVPAGVDRGRPRLWIDRVFAAKGSGTVVTGTLTGGSLGIGDSVHIVPPGHSARVRAIQTRGHEADSIGPGHRVALNLAGVEHRQLERGHAVVTPGRWHLTTVVDASLTVLAALDHDVSRRGAYLGYFGSGEHAVRLRVLGREALRPGTTGAVRLHLPAPLPLLPGDRFVLRESGRDETVGGGEVLDVAPVLRAARARPDRRVERVIAERGWVDADELERLTGERRTPDVGSWVVAPVALEEAVASLGRRIDGAGALGLDVAALDDRERELLLTLDGVEIQAGRARRAGSEDYLGEHPIVAALAAGGMAPPAPAGVSRAELRELQRRGVLVERDGQWVHSSAIGAAAREAARLLARQPAGFTMAEFRDACGTTRKHALPLANELDARGITRRRGDVRIAGPRLPQV